jgi:hypothetical protein
MLDDNWVMLHGSVVCASCLSGSCAHALSCHAVSTVDPLLKDATAQPRLCPTPQMTSSAQQAQQCLCWIPSALGWGPCTGYKGCWSWAIDGLCPHVTRTVCMVLYMAELLS